MRLLINKDFLKDAPYEPVIDSRSPIFVFDERKVDDLVAEILYAQPTCYLVSGYRGSGKTSFIKKVQEKCEQANGNDTARVLFIFSSFSRYENQTFFLRKIIRDLYEAVIKHGQLEGKKESGKKENKRKENKQDAVSLLYKQTFYEVKKERSELHEREEISKIEFSLTRFLEAVKKYGAFLFPILVEGISYLFPGEHLDQILRIVIYGGLGAYAVLSIVNYKKTITRKNTNNEKSVESNIADTDITSYYLEEVLAKFKKQNIKPVFVLDELDKVDDADMELLFKEMKPWLVRGQADFIVVAGQKLSIRYFQSKSKDDDVLSSIFSKIIHVQLQLPEHFIRLFMAELILCIQPSDNDTNKTISLNELDNETLNKITEFCQSIVYQSKMIPRTFMNLLRQEIHWQKNIPYITLQPGTREEDVQRLQLLLGPIGDIRLNGEIPETIKDHIVIVLFQVISKMQLGMTTPIDDLLAPYINIPDQPQIYPYPELFPYIEKYVTTLNNNVPQISHSLDNLAFVEKEQEGESPVQQPSDLKDSAKNEEFVNQFFAFYNMIKDIYPMLVDEPTNFYGESKGKGNLSNDSLSYLLKGFVQEGILNQNIPEAGLLDEKQIFFNHMRTDNKMIQSIRQTFKKYNIVPNKILSALYQALIEKSLKEVFLKQQKIFQDATQLSSYDLLQFDYRLLPFNEKGDEPDILVNYKFTDAIISIDSHRINLDVQFLQDYNAKTRKGNYLAIFLISNDSTGFNVEQERAYTRELINEIYPALTGKLIYFISRTYSPKTVLEDAKYLSRTASAYSYAVNNNLK